MGHSTIKLTREEITENVLDVVKSQGVRGVGVYECADITGHHPTTTSKYLEKLAEAGLIISINHHPVKVFIEPHSALKELEDILGQNG